MTDSLSADAAIADILQIVAKSDGVRLSALSETGIRQRLQLYVDLLVKWNKRINLVGPATLADVWRRHILDSAQLVSWLPPATRVLADLGSGAGLPGLILAILGVPDVHLIESDARKCAFLREAARVTKTKVTIHNCRIEVMPEINADVVTARALAPISSLLPLAQRILRPEGMCLFLKGRNWREEANAILGLDPLEHPSLTQPEAVVLQLSCI